MAGIPIWKVNICLRPLFERYAQKLTSSSHMNDLIPAILEKEKEKLKAELHNVKEASIIFDGTALHYLLCRKIASLRNTLCA